MYQKLSGEYGKECKVEDSHTDVATGVEDFYFRKQIQPAIKPGFYPSFCQFLMKIIRVIN